MSPATDAILTVEVARRDGAATVTARGEIDLSAVCLFSQALRQAASLGEPQVIVDLSAVRYIDSSGIYAILETWSAQGRHPDGLQVRVGASPVAPFLRLAGLDRLMEEASRPPVA